MRYTLLLLFALLFFSSCEKLKDEETHGRIHIKSNGPVKPGEQLKVWIDKVQSNYGYSLKHPNRKYYGISYSTDNANFGDGGWYIAEAYGPSSRKDSIFVEVEIPPISCTPPHNAIKGSYGTVYLQSGGRDTTQQGFEVWAQTGSGASWIFFRFKSGRIQKQSAAYTTTKSMSKIPDRQVYCYSKYNNTHYFINPDQPVYVTIENGQMTISVCDFELTDGYSMVKERIDASVTFNL